MKSGKSYWLSSGKITVMERLLVSGFGLLTFFFLVRVLDPEDYGAWMLFISISTLSDITRHGFFKNPLIRFLNIAKENEKQNLISSSFVLNLLYSIISGAIFIALSSFLASAWNVQELVTLLYLYFPASLFLALFFHCEYVHRANYSFKVPLIGYLVKSGLFMTFVLYYFLSDSTLTLYQLGIYFLITSGVSGLTIFMFSFKYFRFRLTVDYNWFKQLFSYGKFTLGTNLSAVLLRNVDIWMIGWFINPVAVATYNIAIRITNIFEIPTMALASILFPKAVERTKEEGKVAFKRMYEKSVAVILLFSVPFIITVYIFAEELIKVIAGNQYLEAVDVLRVTILYSLLIPFSKQMGILLDAIGKAKNNMLFVIRDASINAILNFILIPLYGIMGATYATLSAYVIILVINSIYLWRNYSVQLTSIGGYLGYFTKQGIFKVKNQIS